MDFKTLEKIIWEHRNSYWTVVYPYIKEMKEKSRYLEGDFKSFTSWTKNSKSGYSDNYLWRIYNAGKVYEEYHKRHPKSVKLKDLKVSADNLVIIRKVSNMDIELRDKLISKLLRGQLKHKDLEFSLNYIRGKIDEVGTPVWSMDNPQEGLLAEIAKNRSWLGNRQTARYRIIKIHGMVYLIESLSNRGISIHELDTRTDFTKCYDMGSKADYYWLVVDKEHVKEAVKNRMPYWGVLLVDNGVYVEVPAAKCEHPKRMELLEDIISATVHVLE